jgi:hypothetical protein
MRKWFNLPEGARVVGAAGGQCSEEQDQQPESRKSGMDSEEVSKGEGSDHGNRGGAGNGLQLIHRPQVSIQPGEDFLVRFVTAHGMAAIVDFMALVFGGSAGKAARGHVSPQILEQWPVHGFRGRVPFGMRGET